MGKQKKPIFKKWWFWVIVVLVIGGISNAVGGGTADNPAESSAVSQAAPSPSYRGTLPSQKPSQAPTQTQAPKVSDVPEETIQPTAVSTPSATPEPIATSEPTPESTPDPTPNPGRDYVLNTNTMKFHYPSCSSVKDIKPGNRQDFTGDRSTLIARGYSPCGRCKP